MYCNRSFDNVQNKFNSLIEKNNIYIYNEDVYVSQEGNMPKQNLYKLFGECYKISDYEKMGVFFHDDVTYSAFDCLYMFRGINNVTKVLIDDTREASQLHYGYYRHKGIFLSHLRECVLVCDKISLECLKIVYFKYRFGKVFKIEGLDPREHKFTRGTII